MKKVDQFKFQEFPRAVDVKTASITDEEISASGGHTIRSMAVESIWFGRDHEGCRAYFGHLMWSTTDEYPLETPHLLMPSARNTHVEVYATLQGGKWWDRLNNMDEVLAIQIILDQALGDYPQVPRGFEGWWIEKSL